MTFTVNGQNWVAVFVDPRSKHLRRSDGSRTIGVTDDSLKTVFLADNLSDEMLDKVFCHELCHVFSFSYGLSMDINTEEIVADFMSLYGRQIIYLLDDIMKILLANAA